MGNSPIYSWGVLLVVALLAATIVAILRGKKFGISTDMIIDLVLYCSIGAIVSARLTFVALNFSLYSSELIKIIYLKDGGLSFIGGLIGGILVGILYCKIKKVKFFAIADFAAPSIAVGYIFGRLGCLLNGCCYGMVTSVPWAMHVSADMYLRHPTQIYAMLTGVIICIATILFDKKKKAYGQTFFLFIMMYTVGRFIIEFFRMESVVLFNPFTMTQVVCFLAFVASFMLYRIFGKEHPILDGDEGIWKEGAPQVAAAVEVDEVAIDDEDIFEEESAEEEHEEVQDGTE